MRNIRTLVASAVIAAMAVGCGDSSTDSTDPNISQNGNGSGLAIRVTGTNRVVVGGTADLGAVVLTSGSDSVANPVVSWVSRTPATATVSGTSSLGEVHGVALGTAWIVASSQDLSDSMLVTVVSSADSVKTDTTATPPAAVASVTVSPANVSVAVNDSVGLFANLKDANGASIFGRTVTWAPSDASLNLVAYGQSALLRPAKAGSFTVTATSEGKSGTRTIVVH